MLSGPTEPERRNFPKDAPPRAAGRVSLVLTFLFVAAALIASSAFVVYTALTEDLQRGVFAILFATMSAQISLNWFRWRAQQDESR